MAKFGLVWTSLYKFEQIRPVCTNSLIAGTTYFNDSDVVPKIICVVFSIGIIKNPKNVLETRFVITLRFLLYVLVKEVQIVYRLFLVNYY